jgi:protein-tyrosine phosphatase
MKPTLYTMSRSQPGLLSTMARPRGGDWIDDEMKGLRTAGVDLVISMLTSSEVNELDLAGEERAAVLVGIRFGALPTPDRGVPERTALAKLVGTVVTHLGRGEHVVVHCRHGIGRASVVVAAVLVSEGADPTTAWDVISDARGLPVPDTINQREFIQHLASEQPG